MQDRELVGALRVPVLVHGIVLAGALLGSGPLARAGDPVKLFAEARTLLESGEPQQALDKAVLGLEFAPDDLAGLDLASRAAQAAKSDDDSLWYASLALEQAGASESAKLADELRKRMAEMDPLGGKDQAVLAGYAATMCELGRDCSSRKLFVNAVDLLLRCRGSASGAKADLELAKIYDDKKAVDALLDSGLDVPLKPRKRKAGEPGPKDDKKHEGWDAAWQYKGENYTIITNLPYDTAAQISLAMEQMNRYYRHVFHVKEKGGDTARVTIKVYRKRKEFEKQENVTDKGLEGFFVPGENRVCTYDPRDLGGSLKGLWETLFHESSHQFTHLISADLIPGWLNEGTASYFEGARLLPNGSVEKNLVPEERLVALEYLIKEGQPKLKDVVSYYKPNSYEAEYYPFGWGLVYFLNNYENEKSERIYQPLYRDYMGAYKAGGKHDVLGRFNEYFVTKAKDPAVKNFEDFEARWKKWIHELNELYFGGPEKADVLIARGKKERADKQPETSIESFRWALRKRPDDAQAYFELAETLAQQKQIDAAIYDYEKAIACLRASDPIGGPSTGGDGAAAAGGAGLEAEARAKIAKLNKDLAEKLAKADAGFVAAATQAAQAYADKGFPLFALRLLQQAALAFGDSRALSELGAKIAAASKSDTRRWRRIPAGADLAGWQAEGYTGEEDALAFSGDGAGLGFAQAKPQIPYRYEVRIDGVKDSKQGIVGLVFGSNDSANRVQGVAVTPDGTVMIAEYEDGWKDDAEIGKLKRDKLASFVLGIEVTRQAVEYFVDGKSMGKKAMTEEKLQGDVGLFAQHGKFHFGELRIRD